MTKVYFTTPQMVELTISIPDAPDHEWMSAAERVKQAKMSARDVTSNDGTAVDRGAKTPATSTDANTPAASLQKSTPRPDQHPAFPVS